MKRKSRHIASYQPTFRYGHNQPDKSSAKMQYDEPRLTVHLTNSLGEVLLSCRINKQARLDSIPIRPTIISLGLFVKFIRAILFIATISSSIVGTSLNAARKVTRRLRLLVSGITGLAMLITFFWKYLTTLIK